MSKVKFLVFADLHHYPGVFYTEARRRLDAIMRRAEAEEVDFAVSLGDFTHSVSSFPEIQEDVKKYSAKLRHVMGNHDTDGTSLKEVLRAYDMPSEYYFFDEKGFRFIALDTDYYVHEGRCIHFEHRNYFDFPDTRETMPEEEMEFLEKAIDDAPGPCVLFSHASLERHAAAAGTANYSRLREIIRKANEKGRRVLLSCNGHHHRDYLRILDNVAYFDVNSASFEWLNNPHTLFPEELRQKFEMIDHQVIFEEPLSAVVTLDSDGTIDISGSKTGFFCGVNREMTPNEICDRAGRPCTAEILSARFRLE